MCVLLSFFFQAEDGIRDLTVTGVQTCALPILLPQLPRPWLSAEHAPMAIDGDELRTAACQRPRIAAVIQDEGSHPSGFRSEERRVGKEGRSMRSSEA